MVMSLWPRFLAHPVQSRHFIVIIVTIIIIIIFVY